MLDILKYEAPESDCREKLHKQSMALTDIASIQIRVALSSSVSLKVVTLRAEYIHGK
jgi:hypothetical protein